VLNINPIDTIINFYQSFGDAWLFPVGGTVLIWILLSAALGSIYKKADQPFVAAFVPVWNIYVFYRLGGYAGIWTILLVASLIAPSVAAFTAVMTAVGGDGLSLTKLGVSAGILGFVTLLSGIGIFLCGIVFFLAAYNIGRAFNKDALMAILFIIATPIWLIALAFTTYEWDEASANPNSIGQMPEYRIARNRRKNHTKKVRKRKAGKADDDDDFLIIDGGSSTAKFDGINFIRD
jgi:hypothetical protein